MPPDDPAGLSGSPGREGLDVEGRRQEVPLDPQQGVRGALAADAVALRGQQEVVIKSVGSVFRETPGIAGATELGDKRAILVLDVGALIEEATRR